MIYTMLVTHDATVAQSYYKNVLHVTSVVTTYRKEGTKHGGELDLGGVDSTHYTGNIYYEEVVQKAYWAIEMDS